MEREGLLLWESLSHMGKKGGSAPASATWDVKGRKEHAIMWWLGAIEMYNDC